MNLQGKSRRKKNCTEKARNRHKREKEEEKKQIPLLTRRSGQERKTLYIREKYFNTFTQNFVQSVYHDTDQSTFSWTRALNPVPDGCTNYLAVEMAGCKPACCCGLMESDQLSHWLALSSASCRHDCPWREDRKIRRSTFWLYGC